MGGKLIVLEGTDGSGKATQAKLLKEALEKKGFSVEMADFPQYGNYSARFVEKYLNGDYGSAEQVGPYKASMFYTIDRYDASFKIKKWLEQGKIVISNRYTSASKGHQAGKLSKEEREKFFEWLDNLEYGIFQIPIPNLVIFLHMPPEIGQKLVGKKEKRSYTEKTHDLHEADLEHLKKSEEAFLQAADKHDNWTKIDCFKGNEPLPIKEIHEMILKEIEKII